MGHSKLKKLEQENSISLSTLYYNNNSTVFPFPHSSIYYAMYKHHLDKNWT